MVIIFVVALTFAGLEEEISSNHLEDGTGETPDISRGVVICANDDFR